MAKDSNSAIRDNLNKSVIYASGANILAALVIFIVFIVTKEYLYLIAAAILVLAGVVFVFLIKSLQRKIDSYSDKSGNKKSDNDNSDADNSDNNSIDNEGEQ